MWIYARRWTVTTGYKRAAGRGPSPDALLPIPIGSDIGTDVTDLGKEHRYNGILAIKARK